MADDASITLTATILPDEIAKTISSVNKTHLLTPILKILKDLGY